MSKRQILILLGVWFGVFLFLGLPEGWHTTIAGLSGLLLIFIAYSLKSESTSPIQNSEAPYVEHKSEVVVSEPMPSAPAENNSDSSINKTNSNPS